MSSLNIQILIDNPTSWVIPYGQELVNLLIKEGHHVRLVSRGKEVEAGDILCLLGCEKRFDALHLNKNNIVVHESDLPKGKGWSPVTWQVLEGVNDIPITLFEAVENIDAGPIYKQKHIHLKGNELIDEIKHLQGLATIALIRDFVEKYPNNIGIEQVGKSTYYERRSSIDSKLDIDQSIREQFNLLRVCDNERYPAFFELNGIHYQLKIEKVEND